ncbi:GNAT superfamily N-acetyltransferase [Pedobacter cryoconitis]|uniref:GNAT family N-acetyltransferase n=1 Tax=Pedobacter cryoconitis TaxID=188932 RepID=UPI00161C0996|nr:GNAT family N-acetyltransferase [Pedobacter cryoconitis]MBB6271842.1 GNAT superfamily N-acetyltransferase [Pedobacter cryoconitis]
MDKIVNFDTAGLFFDKNMSFLETNYYKHFYLLKMYQRIVDGEFKPLDWFNVVDGEHLIICLCSEVGIYIYSESFSNEMIDQLYQRIIRIRYTNIRFFGDKGALTQLFERFNIHFKIKKERVIYATTAVRILKRKHLGQAVNSAIDDFDTLVQYSYDYILEEWGEREGRGIDYVQALVMQCIAKGALVQYDTTKGIGCIAQVLNIEDNMPIIGSLYTPPTFRGNGYATMLVHAVTKKLLENGYEQCGIISDATNPYTNKMFKGIGFNPVSEHLELSCKDFFRTN